RASNIPRQRALRLAHFFLGHLDRQRELIEPHRITHERGVAAAPHPIDNLRNLSHERGLIPCAPGQEPIDAAKVRRFDDTNLEWHHMTILLSGYSTMPCARAPLRRGIRSRTVRSSMMVLMATQSLSLSGEIVGRCSAGSSASTPSRSARRTLSMMPTR